MKPAGAFGRLRAAALEIDIVTETHQQAEVPDRHPLDVVERCATVNAWTFERIGEHELSLAIDGRWCGYGLWFCWEAELDALMMSCAYDMKIPDDRRPAVHELLAVVNERLWVGHFDVFSRDSVPAFRHALLLRGLGLPTDEQLFDLLDVTISECERFYPAFRYVIRGGKSPAEAVQAAIIDAVGEA